MHSTTSEKAITRSRTMIFGMALVCLTTTGCSTLLLRKDGAIDRIDTKGMKMAGYTMGPHGFQRPIPTDDTSPSIILEVNTGKRHFEKIPMVPGQSLFIADLVRDAQLYKKLGRIRASVLRPTGHSRPPVRLDVDFDSSGKNVMDGQNYSLRPGDHVVVSPDERSFLNSLMAEVPFMKPKD